MEATLLCSTGIHLRYGNASVLVDSLNGAISSFKEIPARTASAIIALQRPYENVEALLYTHLHPDHYEQGKNSEFVSQNPHITVFFPLETTPDQGILITKNFNITYFFTPHMPCDYHWVKHYALLVEGQGGSAYFTADAAVDAEIHLRNLAGRQVDLAFWNPLYLSYAPTRSLMESAARHSFVYHVPEDRLDETGIRRKLWRNWSRFGSQLPNTKVLDHYPMEIW